MGPNTLSGFMTRGLVKHRCLWERTNLRGADMKEIFYDAAKSNKTVPIKTPNVSGLYELNLNHYNVWCTGCNKINKIYISNSPPPRLEILLKSMFGCIYKKIQQF